MQKIQTANQLRGMATGAIFAAGFGAVWLASSLSFMQWLSAATVAGVLLGLAVLVSAAILFAPRRLNAGHACPRSCRWAALLHGSMRFSGLAILVVVFVLARLHLDAYVPSAITAIVGLHMFPLARLFRYPPHYLIWSRAAGLGRGQRCIRSHRVSARHCRASEPEFSCGSVRCRDAAILALVGMQRQYR